MHKFDKNFKMSEGFTVTLNLYITDFNVNDKYKDICVISGGGDIANQVTMECQQFAYSKMQTQNF